MCQQDNESKINVIQSSLTANEEASFSNLLLKENPSSACGGLGMTIHIVSSRACRGIHYFLFIFCLLSFFSYSQPSFAENRFQYHGDGEININGQFIQFRQGDNYLENGLKKINQIFSAPWNIPSERMSLRFIELLDYVQDQYEYSNPTIHLKSGYRSPTLNQTLRNKGKLAAQSSMHIEAAAADFYMQGIPSKKVFELIKTLNCCGVGYYGSIHLHLDTGPARYWDQNTSKTEDKTPQLNEKIIIQSTYDYYRAGEAIQFQLMRVTNYPIDINTKMELISLEAKKKTYTLTPNIETKESIGTCWTIHHRKTAREINLDLPKKLTPGLYALKVNVCNKREYVKMADEIISRPFTIID